MAEVASREILNLYDGLYRKVYELMRCESFCCFPEYDEMFGSKIDKQIFITTKSLDAFDSLYIDIYLDNHTMFLLSFTNKDLFVSRRNQYQS